MGVYGDGSFGLVSDRPVVPGACKAMRNRAHEAKGVWLETGPLKGVVKTVSMDGQADEQALCCAFRRPRGMTPLTGPRRNSAHTAKRRAMIRRLNRPRSQRPYGERAQTVEPMPGVVKEIVGLERCWRRGHRHNRWLFAAMGVAVPRHQAQALNEHRSTWKIESGVLGLEKFRDPSSR
jgi:hypothetical protein